LFADTDLTYTVELRGETMPNGYWTFKIGSSNKVQMDKPLILGMYLGKNGCGQRRALSKREGKRLPIL